MEEPSPSGFLRLFVAIPVPEPVRKEIGRAQGRIKRETPPGTVRWTRPDQFHITMKFLGDVHSDQVAALKNSLATVASGCGALQLVARGLGFFPGARKPRVIWAAAHDEGGQLDELHQKIDEALRWLAPAERQEKFIGHITLGRFKPGHHSAIPGIIEQAETFRTREFGLWQADQIHLVQSQLCSDGARHISICEFPLSLKALGHS